MIPIAEAKTIISHSISPLLPVSKPLLEAAGLILAEDVHALVNIPAFDQSAMDGYAFAFGNHSTPLKIQGEMAAGAKSPLHIGSGQAARIFTGAPVPEGADTVVMQEHVTVNDGALCIGEGTLEKGTNVRKTGSEIRKGNLALTKGTVLTPAAIGFLASIGYQDVRVIPLPAVSIIITGEELQQPGRELSFGQVYDSNSYMLRSALNAAGIQNVSVFEVKDKLEQVVAVLGEALEKSDVVLLTGGISVGEYDFVLEASEACGVEKLFHKIRQKPGKPLFFGKKEKKVIFGLPGNPSSALTCFYEYVLLAIDALSMKNGGMKTVSAKINRTYTKKAGLAHYLKGHYMDGEVRVSEAQESFRLSSFAMANCLIYFPEETEITNAGDTVEVHLLPSI